MVHGKTYINDDEGNMGDMVKTRFDIDFCTSYMDGCLPARKNKSSHSVVHVDIASTHHKDILQGKTLRYDRDANNFTARPVGVQGIDL